MSVISKMTFDNGSTKNLIGSTFYGKCITAAATAAKTVTIGGWDESVKDNVSGVTVHVYFTLGNSATDPTLNIDGGGAHPIYVEDNVKAAAFPAGVYSLTLVSVVISGQSAWCWLMEAKTDWSYISNKPSLDFIPTSQKGANSGVAELDANGKVPSSQLPAYVDDVLEYASRSLFPTTGTSGIIYIATDTNLAYRWSGSGYVEISPSLALGETESTAYRGDRGATAYSHATDSGRLTTATSSGLYKMSVTAQGHVGSATAVTKNDITALGIPAQDTTYTLSTGDANGQIKVTPSVGNAYNVDVKGLGSNAYTSTPYLPTAGGNVTGDITLLKQVESGAPGDSYGLIFQRGTLTDSYNDWMIIDSGGYLYFKERGSGSTAWTTRVNFNTSGGVIATGQVQGNSIASSSFLTLGSTATLASGDSLIFVDSSDSNRIKRGGPTFGSSTDTFLRNDGTWATPSVSGYIPTSEKGAASGVATLDTNSKVPIVQSNYLYGKCTTAGSTAAKTVTIAGYDESTIANMEGVTVFVAFKNVSTASNPTLNVSGAGAHAIVTGTYDDPVAVGKFTNGLHAFTLVKALDNSYYWWINEGRDTVPEAPTSAGTYLLTINSSGNVSWSSYTPPAAATVGTVTISASGWSGSGPYSHSVTISGTTANSKIDLQPDSTVLAQMTTDGTTALYIENNNGTLTAWAMGAAPTASLTIQYTKTEVG